MVGNRFLLNIPQKMAVIVHSAYTDEEYADWRRKWLACGEAGGVLVSASIATREKVVTAVSNAARNLGPTITSVASAAGDATGLTQADLANMANKAVGEVRSRIGI